MHPPPALHLGTTPSPPFHFSHSSHSVNEVVSAIQRKFSISHVEQTNNTTPTPRRPSFSRMDTILHPKKKDKRSDSSDVDARKDRPKSLSMRGGAKSKDRANGQSPRLAPIVPGKFEVIIESPPLCFYGGAQNSTGALLSGRLQLRVEDPTGSVKLQTFTAVLRLAISTKKPVGKDCLDCRERYETIHTWTFLTEAKTFQRDHDNQFPFSYLLKGSLPASTDALLGALRYEIIATAATNNHETITTTYPIVIQRAIPPGPDRSSIRIFPPTNLTGRVVLPSVVHPIGTFPIQMTVSGVVENKKESQTRWRLNKLLWRIEETTSITSVPCSKHSSKVADGKAVKTQESKILGHGEMKSGWKTDFDTPGGELYMELEMSVATKVGQKGVCNLDSEAGLEIKHSLIVELIVAEEFVPKKNKSVITPTGAARILRMAFNLVVTNHTGMGISWDEEMPPLYEDVPDSPPTYPSGQPTGSAFAVGETIDYTGELEFTDLERLVSANPSDPPRYRERDAQDVHESLSMRSEARSSLSEPGPSQLGDLGEDVHRPRIGPVFGAGDLDFEPPQYALRQRQASDGSQQVNEDYEEGETA